MKISHIKINQILGIADLEFEAGNFNTIEGQNGVGKTSVLEAIKSAFTTGHDATLLRTGEEKGEIVFVLDDGVSITKKVGLNSSTTEVRDKDGKKVGRPAEAISKLIDLISINPVAFLMAQKKDRVKVLLETMPITVDMDELTKISGITATHQEGIHGLAVIEALKKQVYDDRTGTNRAVTEKDATINQLRIAMPPEVEGVTMNEEELLKSIEDARTKKDEELARINKKLEFLKDEAAEKTNTIRVELQKKIDELKDEAVKKVDVINEELASNRAKADIVSTKANDKFIAIATPANEQIAIIRNDREAAIRRKQTLETIEKLATELEELKVDSAKQTKAINDLDAYKIGLLAKLPVKGLEVVDGDIYREGVQFDRLNTAQQVQIAVDIAKLRAGDLGVVCVDGLEFLDSATFDQFKIGAMESKLQLFVTRVGDGEFSITTEN